MSIFTIKISKNYDEGFKDGFIAGIHAARQALKSLNKISTKAMGRYLEEIEKNDGEKQ